MARWNVELKFQTTVESETGDEAYNKAKELLLVYPEQAFLSHCKKVKAR